MEFQNEKMGQRDSQIMILTNNVDKMKEENMMLSAAVKEGDKTREVLTRQMTHAMQQEIQLQHRQRDLEQVM